METLIKISKEEYLEKEAKASFKSEYHNGEVVAMAGSQLAYNQIVANLLGELYICLKGRNCQVLPSDMLLRIPACEKYVYPDISIVCDTIQLDEQKQRGLEVLLNPTIVIEVLSESTAVYDQSEKMRCYFTLQSLTQYVLVDSERVVVSTYTRGNENAWLFRLVEDENENVKIGDCNITLKDIYAKVEW